MTVAERVRLVILEALAVDPLKLTDDSMLVDDLGADSLDGVELSMRFEDEFAISIVDGDLHPLIHRGSRVRDVVALVERLGAR